VARDGLEALEVAARHPRPIDLLLTDVVMPRMNGRELVGRLRAARPEVKVLYMSGYLDKDLKLASEMLKKPFSPEALAAQVGSTLGADSPITGRRQDEKLPRRTLPATCDANVKSESALCIDSTLQ
jgi:CheY-like chemotaxis protein